MLVALSLCVVHGLCLSVVTNLKFTFYLCLPYGGKCEFTTVFLVRILVDYEGGRVIHVIAVVKSALIEGLPSIGSEDRTEYVRRAIAHKMYEVALRAIHYMECVGTTQEGQSLLPQQSRVV